jgi:hypothetical protein
MSNYAGSEFKPKLSKHELILQRYKNLLNSPSMIYQENEYEAKSKLQAHNKKVSEYSNITDKTKKLFEKIQDKPFSPIVEKINLPYKNNSTSLNSIYHSPYLETYNNNSTLKNTDSNLSNIENIKNKYHKRTDANQLQSQLKFNKSYFNNSSINPISNNIIIDNLHGRELEYIRKKYLNKCNEKETTAITNKLNTIIEEKIIQLKKQDDYSCRQIIASQNKKIIESIEHNKEIIFNTNNNLQESLNENYSKPHEEENTEHRLENNSFLFDKISNIEEKLKQHLKDENMSDKNTMVKKLDLSTIESKIEKLKNIKKEQKNFFISNTVTKNSSGITDHILSKLIYSVTGQLFTNENNKQINNNDTSIDNEINTRPKNLKLRANSAPKKKIMTFDEFIDKDG